ncbi:hypothetical protein [Bradyrhizobium sp. WD16]|nr:hypothetical protein [Bradyrhizobium sp. WD16]
MRRANIDTFDAEPADVIEPEECPDPGSLHVTRLIFPQNELLLNLRQ